MKKLLIVGLLGLTFASTGQAATDTGTFDVNITLNSKCVYTKTADVAFTYTSFETGPVNSTDGAFTVKCTNTLPYSLSLDGTGTYTDAAVNLQYTLNLSGTTGLAGTGADQSYTISGAMAGNQAGTCATAGGVCTNASSTNKTRTVTITY